MQFNKPPEWGQRFQFPENMKFEYERQVHTLVNEVAVKMAEKYDNFIVEQIAMEARASGISDLTVLNKGAILEALQKMIPQKVDGLTCPRCGRIDILANHFAYCSKCGQALDWRTDDD